jgi:hypothetical protein
VPRGGAATLPELTKEFYAAEWDVPEGAFFLPSAGRVISRGIWRCQILPPVVRDGLTRRLSAWTKQLRAGLESSMTVGGPLGYGSRTTRPRRRSG